MKELLIILVSSAIVHNVVLSQFLGLCPFFGVSKKTETAVGMGGALVFVITLSSSDHNKLCSSWCCTHKCAG